MDFVFIDAGHSFDDAARDIIEWAKKVRKGGIVSGHDYTHVRGGVKDAVDGYVKFHSQSLKVIHEAKEDATWWFYQKWRY